MLFSDLWFLWDSFCFDPVFNWDITIYASVFWLAFFSADRERRKISIRHFVFWFWVDYVNAIRRFSVTTCRDCDVRLGCTTHLSALISFFFYVGCESFYSHMSFCSINFDFWFWFLVVYANAICRLSVTICRDCDVRLWCSMHLHRDFYRLPSYMIWSDSPDLFWYHFTYVVDYRHRFISLFWFASCFDGVAYG